MLLLIGMVFVTLRSINHDLFSFIMFVGRVISVVSLWYMGSNLEEEILLMLASLLVLTHGQQLYLWLQQRLLLSGLL